MEYVPAFLASLEAKSIQHDLNLVSIRGIPQNPTFNVEKFENLIDQFETHDNDVFIATFVKAGTTWTQQIVSQILRNGELGGFYGEMVPWLEAVTSELLQPREAPTWTIEKIASNNNRRFFKTHATVAHLPKGKAAIKVIYVARNCKDTAVSLYHHAKSKPEFGFTGSFDTFCELFLAGKVENGLWFDHVLDWYKLCQSDPSKYLFLKYEDMYDNPKEAVRTISTFLDIPVEDDVLDAIVRNSTIGEMRVHSSFGLNHLRQGGYGGWRSMFTVAMSELFDDVSYVSQDIFLNIPNDLFLDYIVGLSL